MRVVESITALPPGNSQPWWGYTDFEETCIKSIYLYIYTHTCIRTPCSPVPCPPRPRRKTGMIGGRAPIPTGPALTYRLLRAPVALPSTWNGSAFHFAVCSLLGTHRLYKQHGRTHNKNVPCNKKKEIYLYVHIYIYMYMCIRHQCDHTNTHRKGSAGSRRTLCVMDTGDCQETGHCNVLSWRQGRQGCAVLKRSKIRYCGVRSSPAQHGKN